MNIVVISASTRAGSQSRIVSEYIESKLIGLQVHSTIIDLSESMLPLFNGARDGVDMWPGLSEILQRADGYVFVSPEWDGMMSVGLHNLIHYIDKEMADKPVAIVGVSSGIGGRYPLLQMRIMGYKNKRYVVIPESLFFDRVKESFEGGELTDSRLVDRTNYVLRVLIEYSKALQLVRQSGVVDYGVYPNGL